MPASPSTSTHPKIKTAIAREKSFFPTRITRYVTSYKPISRFCYFLKKISFVSEILALGLGFETFPDLEWI